MGGCQQSGRTVKAKKAEGYVTTLRGYAKGARARGFSACGQRQKVGRLMGKKESRRMVH